MQPKRILYVVGALELGGIERLTVNLSLGLQNTGRWKPVICCVEKKKGPFLETLESCGIPVLECKLSTRKPLKFVNSFSQLISEHQIDLVHSHVNSSIPLQVLGAHLRGGKPIMFTQHNEYQQWMSSYLSHLRIILYYHLSRRFIAEYTAVSQGTQHYLARLVFARANSIPVINNPVDVTVFRPNAEHRERIRAELGVTDANFVVGNVASLTEKKGHIYLLRAAQVVLQKDPNLRFVLSGHGPLRESLETEVVRLGIDKAVIFLGARTDASVVYNGFDCFVLSSLWEGAPTVLPEAMASGIPIISTAVGGSYEFLGEDYPQIVPIGDAVALAQAILQVKLQPDKQIPIVERSLNRVRADFSVEAILEQYIALYKRILHIRDWN